MKQYLKKMKVFFVLNRSESDHKYQIENVSMVGTFYHTALSVALEQ